MAHVLIAAAHKSSGKTTVTLGLGRALRDRGLKVQTFKKGPDYIDPMWHARAVGRPCYNLDFNTQSHAEISHLLASRSAGADISLIEANKGLFDGVDLEGRDSNAALAAHVGAPVILVVDTEGITRGIAPLLVGYAAFDPNVNIAGVILNKVAGPRHARKLREAVAHYTDIPVLGCLRRDESLAVRERHLGLTTPTETDEVEDRIRRIADAVRAGVDLDAVLTIAGTSPPLQVPAVAKAEGAAAVRGPRVRIAVARDTAFGFYYPDDLETLQRAGADLAFFDTLRDTALPDADALLIGGGFPETQISGLTANRQLRMEIRHAIENGMPAYAECGGLMYMCRSITFNGVSGEMVGAVPGDAIMHAKPQGRGQVKLIERGATLWPRYEDRGGGGARPNPHEFHYAGISGLPESLAYAYDVVRGDGIDGKRDGVIVHNLLATFSHQRDTDANPWARRFVAFVRETVARRHHASVA
ncbi:MAG: cobyrinate a,c-diamide synthase [Hyphomicrobiaceae bacterium]